jgi:hypothetical protein
LHVKYDTISFTQQPLTEIPGGKVYLRYFRHGCPRNYYFKPVKLEYRVWGIGVNYYDLPPNAAASMMDTFLPDTLGAVITCGPLPPMSHPIYDGIYRLYIDNVEQQAALVIKNDSIFYWVDTYPSGGYQHSFMQQPISFRMDSTHFTVDLLDGCLLNGLACHLDGYLSDAGGAHISGLAWKGEIGKNTVAFYALKMDVND